MLLALDLENSELKKYTKDPQLIQSIINTRKLLIGLLQKTENLDWSPNVYNDLIRDAKAFTQSYNSLTSIKRSNGLQRISEIVINNINYPLNNSNELIQILYNQFVDHSGAGSSRPYFWCRVVNPHFTWITDNKPDVQYNTVKFASTQKKYLVFEKSDTDSDRSFALQMGPFNKIYADRSMYDHASEVYDTPTRETHYKRIINDITEDIHKTIKGDIIPLLIGIGYSGTGKTSTLISTKRKGVNDSDVHGVAQLLLQKMKVVGSVMVTMYELYENNPQNETLVWTDSDKNEYKISLSNGTITFSNYNLLNDVSNVEVADVFKSFIRMAWRKSFGANKLSELTKVYDIMLKVKKTRETTNNPESSRSFLLFKIEAGGKTILIGDLPGQEVQAGINPAMFGAVQSRPTKVLDWNAFVTSVVGNKPIQLHVLTLVREEDKFLKHMEDYFDYYKCVEDEAKYNYYLQNPLLETQNLEKKPVLLPGAELDLDKDVYLAKFINEPLGILNQVSLLSHRPLPRLCANKDTANLLINEGNRLKKIEEEQEKANALKERKDEEQRNKNKHLKIIRKFFKDCGSKMSTKGANGSVIKCLDSTIINSVLPNTEIKNIHGLISGNDPTGDRINSLSVGALKQLSDYINVNYKYDADDLKAEIEKDIEIRGVRKEVKSNTKLYELIKLLGDLTSNSKSTAVTREVKTSPAKSSPLAENGSDARSVAPTLHGTAQPRPSSPAPGTGSATPTTKSRPSSHPASATVETSTPASTKSLPSPPSSRETTVANYLIGQMLRLDQKDLSYIKQKIDLGHANKIIEFVKTKLPNYGSAIDEVINYQGDIYVNGRIIPQLDNIGNLLSIDNIRKEFLLIIKRLFDTDARIQGVEQTTLRR